MVYAQPGIPPGELDAQFLWEFKDTNGPPNLGQLTKKRKQKENLRNIGFCRPLRPQSKILKIRRDKYLDFARKAKKMENERDGDTNWIWCTTIPIEFIKELEVINKGNK